MQERFVVHITDVLAVSMMLGITAQVKEAGVAWDKGEKKSKDPKRGHGWGQQGGGGRFRGCRPFPQAQQTCPGDPGGPRGLPGGGSRKLRPPGLWLGRLRARIAVSVTSSVPCGRGREGSGAVLLNSAWLGSSRTLLEAWCRHLSGDDLREVVKNSRGEIVWNLRPR